MNRRTFLTATAVVALSPAALWAGSGMIDFDDSDPITQALSAGKTVFVDYAADWCSTCAAQDRVITALRAQNPAYDDKIVFVRVDWDTYRRHQVTTSRRIPRRSTLIVLKGNQELGRIVAGTSQSQIKELMDIALKAGSTT